MRRTLVMVLDVDGDADSMGDDGTAREIAGLLVAVDPDVTRYQIALRHARWDDRPADAPRTHRKAARSDDSDYCGPYGTGCTQDR